MPEGAALLDEAEDLCVGEEGQLSAIPESPAVGQGTAQQLDYARTQLRRVFDETHRQAFVAQERVQARRLLRDDYDALSAAR